MMRPLAPPVLVLLIVLATAAPVQAQTDDTTEQECAGFDVPCWVIIVLGLNVLLIVAVIARTAFLARRIQRGRHAAGTEFPPDLQVDTPGDEVEFAPPRSFPPEPAPWPDQQLDPLARPRREPPSSQVEWGDFHLWFDDGEYFFSVEDGHEKGWLPCFAVPKAHRIVAGRDGVPKLERVDPRHRRD